MSVWLAVALALGGAGCDEQPAEDDAPPAPTGAPPEPDGAATGAATADAVAGEEKDAEKDTGVSSPPSVTLGFVGDMAFALHVGRWIRKREQGEEVPAGVDRSYPFTHVEEALSGPDLLVGNLECVVSNQGATATDHNPFRAPLVTPRLLKDAGFDLVSVANNHARDFGRVAFEDMLDNLEAAGLPYVGAHTFDRKPSKPFVAEIDGLQIGVLGYYIIPASLERARADIEAAREKVDVVVVYNHWGLEGHQEPANGQGKWAPALVDAGADLVVGTHTHVLQGEQWFEAREGGRKRLVYFGLGNFVFTGMSYDRLHAVGGYLEVDVDPRGVVERRLRRIELDSLGAPRFIDSKPVEPCEVVPHCPPSPVTR